MFGSRTDGDQHPVRVRVTERAVLLVVAGVVAGLVLAHVLAEARSVLALFTAAAVGALLIDPPVEFFSRHMRRILAIVLTLVIVAAGYGIVYYGVLHDLSTEVAHLQRDAPRAARRIEQSDRFGDAARKFQLTKRVEQAVETLKKRTSGASAPKAARRFGSYFVGVVLMLFLLSWGPRWLRAACEQIRDPVRRRRVELVTLYAMVHTRRYLLLAVAQAIVAGIVSYSVFWLVGLAAPVALALLVALGTILPYVGTFIGGIPALLLAAGFLSAPRAWTVVAVVLAIQIVQIVVVQPRITEHVLYAGPALIGVTFLVGYELYGLGGGLYGYAIAIAALAVTEAIGTERVYAPSGAVADE